MGSCWIYVFLPLAVGLLVIESVGTVLILNVRRQPAPSWTVTDLVTQRLSSFGSILLLCFTYVVFFVTKTFFKVRFALSRKTAAASCY